MRYERRLLLLAMLVLPWVLAPKERAVKPPQAVGPGGARKGDKGGRACARQ